MELGTVEGSVNTESFRFEAHRDVEKFDFVTVKANTDEAEWLLAQIDEVEKKPVSDSEKVDSGYKTVASAYIIGYRYKGMLKKPRSVIEPDSIVYYADQSLISKVLGLDENGLYMGHLITNPDINIYMDPEELYKHIAVLAKTGYGKSYTVGVMIEELLEKDYPIVIIDPHGEYSSIGLPSDELTEEQKEMFKIQAKGYPVKEFSPNTDLNKNAEKLSFSSKNLSAKEIQQIVPTTLTNSQLGVLYTALKDLKKRDVYTFEDVIDKCMDQDSKAKWNLINILETVNDAGIFSPEPTGLKNIIRRGQATVINLRAVDPENQEIVVFKLAKEMFEMRKRGELEPFIMVLEEAHNFVPEKGMGKAICSDILRKVASEGRKFGLGMGVISQRPANVAKNILSQCNTQLILRVTNPNDLKAISRSFEGITSSVKNSITGLQTGVGLILGKEQPILTNIRPRRSKHGGTTQTLSSEGGGKERKKTLSDKAKNTELEIGGFESEDSSEEGEEDELDVEVSDGYEGEDFEEPDDGKEEHHEVDEVSDEEGEEDELVDAYVPEFSMDEAGEFSDGKKVFYPVWEVETGVGTIAVDGVEGGVMARDLNLTEDARRVLDVLDKSKSIRDIVESTGLGKEKVEGILDQLEDFELVERSGNGFVRSRCFLDFDRGKMISGGFRVIHGKVSARRARKTAEKDVGKDSESVDKVYRVYYRKEDRVYDPYKGMEI